MLIANLILSSFLSCDKALTKTYNYWEAKDKAPISYYHKGGSSIEASALLSQVQAVQSHLSFLPNSLPIQKLVAETIMVESTSGYWVKQMKGVALGIAQIEPATYKDLKEWLKKKPQAYKQVFSFYDAKSSEEFNLKHNKAFNIALVSAFYWRYKGDKLEESCQSLIGRYILYKTRYNSLKGKTTLQKYISAVRPYG